MDLLFLLLRHLRVAPANGAGPAERGGRLGGRDVVRRQRREAGVAPARAPRGAARGARGALADPQPGAEDPEMTIGEQRRRGPGGLIVPVYSGISKTVLLVRTGISHKPISTEFSKLHCQFGFRPLII